MQGDRKPRRYKLIGTHRYTHMHTHRGRQTESERETERDRERQRQRDECGYVGPVVTCYGIVNGVDCRVFHWNYWSAPEAPFIAQSVNMAATQ